VKRQEMNAAEIQVTRADAEAGAGKFAAVHGDVRSFRGPPALEVQWDV
jgi:hypothetical protein